MAKTNGEGYTWLEWKTAAHFHQETHLSATPRALKAWEDGVDPSDWLRYMQDIDSLVKDLRDDVERDARNIIALMNDRPNSWNVPTHPAEVTKALDAMVEQVALLHDRYYKRDPQDKRSFTKAVRKLLGYTYP